MAMGDDRHDSMTMSDERHDGPGTIKVLIAEVPALLAAVVRQAVDEESDMTVVEQVATTEQLRQALHRPVDVVVTSSSTTALAQFQALLFGPTPLPIVVISRDGARIDVYGRSVTRGVGIDDLARLIREAVASARPRTGG
jgi:DNA-binding NarL/FixJ family response regulator